MQFFPFVFSLQSRRSPSGPGLAHSCQGTSASKLEHTEQPPSRTCLQPKALTYVQIHFWFSEVRRDFHPKYYVCIFNAASCVTWLTLTMNNSICHSSSWMTKGKTQAEATLCGQHGRALASSLSFSGPDCGSPYLPQHHFGYCASLHPQAEPAPRDRKGALIGSYP